MSLYPTLEDMQVHTYQKAQVQATEQAQQRLSAIQQMGTAAPYPPNAQINALASVYPSLMEEYMGLHLEPPTGALVTQPQAAGGGQVALPSAPGSRMIAPITGNDVGLLRAQVTHGIREVILCKDQMGKVGLRLRAVNTGVFVQFVSANSPASLAGMRVGDQVLQIDGKNIAGFSSDKAMACLKNAQPQRIVLAVRDRPFERTITLHKDSTGHVGFAYKNGKITGISKDTSAARNGLLTEHQIVELNGQNVIGLKDKELGEIIDKCGAILTVTVIPTYIYEHMMKSMSNDLIKKMMDHSVPDVC